MIDLSIFAGIPELDFISESTGLIIGDLEIMVLKGRSVQRMNPLMLLGSITGAMTSGGALSVINSQYNSTIASIGYTGAYAFANVLLTVAGALIVMF